MTNESDFSSGNVLNGNLLKGSPKNDNTPFLSLGPKLYEFYLLNIKEDILMDIVDGRHLRSINTMEVKGYCQLYPSSAFICLVTSILQNILFCVQQKKETHKQVEGEKILT